MENGEQKQDEKPPEGRCWVEKGVLRVEVPLFMVNGEYVAYGMLHKATTLVEAFFKHIEKEAARKAEGSRILTPVGTPRVQ